MYLIGNIALILGIVISLYSLAANIIGMKKNNRKWLESARGGILSLAFVTSISAFLLFYILGTSQFQFKYVAAYTNNQLPLVYKLAAFWAGNAGSLLLWAFLLSIYAAIIVLSKKKQNNMIPYVSNVLLLNILFFYIVMVFNANPFEMTDTIPADGKGLNPMLQNPGMVIHPVTLYMGYVGLAVPFAYAIAALLMKNMDSGWIKLTRRWTLTAWLFLTIGNIVGGWWAYLELGWGGYWAWDPVENASFLPWLTVSAFLHSVMIQERKNMLRTWNLSLIILSYILSLFGTFLVRSGILTSVHAFGDSNLGTYFLIFMAFMMIFAIYVVITRYQLIKKESKPIEAYFSKESSFLLNNFILVAAAFAVFFGTMYPLISETLTGTKVNVGAPYFNKVMAPIMLALLLLMAICPLISWQKAVFERFLKNTLAPIIVALLFAGALVAMGVKGIYAIIGLTVTVFMFNVHLAEFWRGVRARRKATKEGFLKAAFQLTRKNQRRYGGYIVHIGIAVIAVGVISSNAYSEEVMKTVNQGESFKVGNYELTFNELTETEERGNGIVAADIDVKYKGKSNGTIHPEKIFYGTWPEPSSEVAIKTNWKEDLYVVLSSWESKEKVTVVVKINPFVSWIWAGGILMMIGTAIALIGGKTSSFFRVNGRQAGVQS
ncbi:heme lyase CcmF/NrfE family subunit [Cytobacillus solani]|uniref:Cytochrome C biogenesis protein n=1 Tax=Cytobacillus solani TaxID=1637975 RepID=A0A0Q3VIP1_9BACI|nr:heme lyase CcmF/NrfE family subunit [Cytobacillus solani]KOP83821.1 cytochrome C biogenesis protein [Bacillus sp. FJAT-21945]KQL20898.1 cytochrome C biogenesis protein [Cytobacillus solani]USK54143.1 heme lyase CcmF/NrfE family subunit [Cytobacillus solani]